MPRAEINRIVLPRTPTAMVDIPAAAYTPILATDNAQFLCTGRELLLVRNPTAGAIDMSIVGQANSFATRAASTTPTLQPSNPLIAGPFPVDGWMTGSGVVNVNVTANGLVMVVLELPPGIVY